MVRRSLFFLSAMTALLLTGCPVGPDVQIENIKIVTDEPSDTESSDPYPINLGSTLQLSAEILPEGANDITLIWTSSDPECAPVRQDGLVSGENIAVSVIISAISVTNDVSDDFEVTVEATKIIIKK